MANSKAFEKVAREARIALERAQQAWDAVTGLAADIAELAGFVLWRSTTVAAAASTYFTIEDFGTVAAGEVWVIEAVVLAGSKPAATPTLRRATSLKLQGSATRATGGPGPVVAYTLANADGGTLAGFSTGVRLVVVGNNVELQGRVTTADTIHLRWRRAIEQVAIA